MATDRELIKLSQKGALGSSLATPGTSVDALHRRMLNFVVPIADHTTLTKALPETQLVRVPHAFRIVSVYVTTPVNVTANDTNYATITVSKRTAGGGATTMWAQNTKITGGLGNLTALTPVALSQSSTADGAAGDSLTLTIAKAASGIALTADTSHVGLTIEIEEI